MDEQNIKNAFYHINSYKRHRALYDIEKSKPIPDRSIVQMHELKMYKCIDKLELSLRALQKEQRESAEENEKN